MLSHEAGRPPTISSFSERGVAPMSARSRVATLALRAASALAAQTPPGGGSSRTCVALEAACNMLPHPAKRATNGEDAYFVGEAVYGVFDGVGGWANKGVDAGEFSRRLASGTHAHLTRDPHAGLETALAASLSQVRVKGSCTACLLRIDPNEGMLSALNLGDSGWRLFRPRGKNKLRVAAASEAQQHSFNVRKQRQTDERVRKPAQSSVSSPLSLSLSLSRTLTHILSLHIHAHVHVMRTSDPCAYPPSAVPTTARRRQQRPAERRRGLRGGGLSWRRRAARDGRSLRQPL